MSIRNIILKLHLWVGMAAALLILLLAASGTLLVYENEIDRLLNPKLLTVTPQPGHMPLQELVTRVRQSFGNQPVVNLGINPRPDLAWQVILGGKAIVFAYVNPHTGQVMGTRKRDASLMFKIHQFHTNLLVGKNGEKLVGYGTLCLAFLILTGLVLWWKRKMLTIQTAGSWRRINFDLHHISGIYSSLFLAVVVFTGLLISFPSALNPAVELFTGSTEREVPEEKPESQPQKDVPTINPDQALSIARAQLPGASPTFMGLPLGPKGVYGISFKFPEDRTPGGRSQVVLDRYTGGGVVAGELARAAARSEVRQHGTSAAHGRHPGRAFADCLRDCQFQRGGSGNHWGFDLGFAVEKEEASECRDGAGGRSPLKHDNSRRHHRQY